MRGKLHFLQKSTGALYRRNSVAFFLYMLLQIIVSLGFVFFFTTVFTARSSYLQEAEQMSEIRVRFDSSPTSQQSKEALEQLQTDERVAIKDIYFVFSEIETNTSSPHITYMAQLTSWDLPVEGENITPQMVETRKKVLVMGTIDGRFPSRPNEIGYPNNQINDEVKVQGKNYRIIGYSASLMPNTLVIPYTTGLDDLQLKSMTVKLPVGLSDNEKEQYGSLITRAFPGAKVDVPPPVNQLVLANMIIPLITSILVGISAMLSFLYIFKYMMQNARRDYEIYWICGGTARSLFINLFLQLSILYTICFAAGTGLFAIFRQVFVGSSFFKGTTLHLSQVGYVYLASFFLLVMIALPFLIRFSRKFRNGGTKK